MIADITGLKYSQIEFLIKIPGMQGVCHITQRNVCPLIEPIVPSLSRYIEQPTMFIRPFHFLPFTKTALRSHFLRRMGRFRKSRSNYYPNCVAFDAIPRINRRPTIVIISRESVRVDLTCCAMFSSTSVLSGNIPLVELPRTRLVYFRRIMLFGRAIIRKNVYVIMFLRKRVVVSRSFITAHKDVVIP